MASSSSIVTVTEYPHYRSAEDLITDGYGEYIVFRNSEQDRQVGKELFRKVFPLLRGSDARSALIEKHIQAIDPSLNIAFVPRVLYELLLTEAVIKHELETQMYCASQHCGEGPFVPTFDSKVVEGFWSDSVSSDLDTCWHVSGMVGDRWIESANEEKRQMRAELVKILAYRVNHLCVEKLRPEGHFTLGQMREHINQALVYFYEHSDRIFRYIEFSMYFRGEGPAINFGTTRSAHGRVNAQPTAITLSNRWLVDRALALECSQAAENAVILYRAGNVDGEKQIPPEKFKELSLSFGTSLLGGAFEDGTACVFHYGAYRERSIYALLIPRGELASSPFYIHSTDPIDQLNSVGELFHARTLVGAEWDGKIVGGIFINPATRPLPPFVFTERSSAEVCALFRSYLEKAVSL